LTGKLFTGAASWENNPVDLKYKSPPAQAEPFSFRF
jgi:hypothetical protein